MPTKLEQRITELEKRNVELEQRIQQLEDKQPVTKFVKPTYQEVYAQMEKGLDKALGIVVAPEYVEEQTSLFIDHYTANGWKVGSVPMKSWKATISGTWLSNIKNKRFNGKINSANNSNNLPGNGSHGKSGFGRL
jgi:hypothetical protein